MPGDETAALQSNAAAQVPIQAQPPQPQPPLQPPQPQPQPQQQQRQPQQPPLQQQQQLNEPILPGGSSSPVLVGDVIIPLSQRYEQHRTNSGQSSCDCSDESRPLSPPHLSQHTPEVISPPALPLRAQDYHAVRLARNYTPSIHSERAPGQIYANPLAGHMQPHVFGALSRPYLSGGAHRFDSPARQGTQTPEPGTGGVNHHHYHPHHQHHPHQYHHAVNQTQVIDYDGLNAAIAEASLLEAGFSKPSFLDQGDDPNGPFPLARSATTGSALRASSSNEFRRRSARKTSYYSERSPRPPLPEQPRYTFFSRSTGVIQAPSMAKILTNAIISDEDGVHEVSVFSDLLKDGCYWLDILDPDDFDMQVLAKYFNIHPLTIEDISTEEVREKYEVFRHYYFVCFCTFDQDYNSESYLKPANVYSLVLKDGIITFHFRPTNHHLNVLLRIEQMQSHITLTPDWINYAMMDDITDGFASPIRTIEYEVDSIDELVLLLRENETTDMLRRIGSCRKNVMTMTRLLANKADIVRGLMKRYDER
ncbi:CorA metal ion transporter, partial [Actinomortierella ambigua]